MIDEHAGLTDFTTLYHRAFTEYGTQALWNMRPIEAPDAADALAITKALRTHGGMDGRRLAEQIESICRAPHSPPDMFRGGYVSRLQRSCIRGSGT